MLNNFRLMLITVFMGLFLIACGETEQASTGSSSSSEVSNNIEEGMTEEGAIAKFGEPTIQQTRTLDSLTITNMEWHNEDGIVSIQFQNGKEKFNQFIPAE